MGFNSVFKGLNCNADSRAK